MQDPRREFIAYKEFYPKIVKNSSVLPDPSQRIKAVDWETKCRYPRDYA
jgi:hypothetical protein